MAMFLKRKQHKPVTVCNRYKYSFATKNVSTDEIRWKPVKLTCSAIL